MSISVGQTKLKTVLVFSLALNFIASFFVVKRLYWNYLSKETKIQISVPNTPQKISYWLNRDELFEKLPKDTNDIVFVGNSLTQHFELAELFQNLQVKNRGINGDITAGILNRLTPIIGDRPKKIFIEIGINDLGHKISNDSILKNYQKIIDTLKSSCPTTNLYVQSILPVADSSLMPKEYCSPTTNQNIQLINKRLKEYTDKTGVTFIDLYPQFVKDGQLNPTFSVDGVHLTGDAYLLWTKILKPYVDK